MYTIPGGVSQESNRGEESSLTAWPHSFWIALPAQELLVSLVYEPHINIFIWGCNSGRTEFKWMWKCVCMSTQTSLMGSCREWPHFSCVRGWQTLSSEPLLQFTGLIWVLNKKCTVTAPKFLLLGWWTWNSLSLLLFLASSLSFMDT